jgi:hypothetical protein
MPRFQGERDIAFFQQVNKELLDDVIEAMVVLYKLSIEDSPTNIYGEAPLKRYYQGVQTSALINRQDKSPTSDGKVIDFQQTAVFSFLREIMKEKGIYPEPGDIVEYDGSFWEINNAAENQLLGDQPYLNWAIICTCHMTRRSQLQITERQYVSSENL